jgi:fibronectin-binding autotransporter adhesin
MIRRLSSVLAVAALALAGFSAVAHADGGTTYVWVGSSQDPNADGHSWTDARNWSPGGVPGDGDSVVIAPPDATHCTAAVDNVPSVTLANLSIAQPPQFCGTSVTGGPLTVTGSFGWDGGALHAPLTLAAGSAGTISATNGIRNAVWADIDVAGSLTLDDLTGTGSLFFTDYSALHLTVEPGATLSSSGATELSALSCCNTPAMIVNNGTLRVESGRLHARGIEVDQNGTLSVAHGASLDSDSGLATAADGAKYTGAGTWTIEDGAHATLHGGQYLAPTFHLQLGTVGALAGVVLGGTFYLRGTGTFDWSAGTLGGRVTVAHTAHVNVSGTTVNNGRRQFAATDPSGTQQSRLTNHGTMTVDDGGAFTVAAGVTLTNASDGVLDLASGTTINGSACCLAPAILANAGGLVVAGTAADATPVALPSMSYQDLGGTTSIAAGTSLQLFHGPRHKLSATQLVGGGTLQVGGATSVAGATTLADGTIVALTSGGTLDGTGTINGAGSVQWTGGSMSGNVTLAPQGGTSVSGTSAKSIAPTSAGTPSTVRVQTALTFAAGTSAGHDYLELGSSNLVLAGHTSVPAFVEIHAGALTNKGTLTVTAGADHVDRTGPTETTVNTGTLSVVSGTLALANTFEQDAGTLAVTATATGNGRLTVTHAASIAGTLRVVNQYVPAVGTVLSVVTAAGLTWTGTVTSTGSGTGTAHWVAAPTATALAVQWQAN